MTLRSSIGRPTHSSFQRNIRSRCTALLHPSRPLPDLLPPRAVGRLMQILAARKRYGEHYLCSYLLGHNQASGPLCRWRLSRYMSTAECGYGAMYGARNCDLGSRKSPDLQELQGLQGLQGVRIPKVRTCNTIPSFMYRCLEHDWTKRLRAAAEELGAAKI